MKRPAKASRRATGRVNTGYFTSLLGERGMSLRGLAKHLGLDPSAVSLMFRDKRQMQMSEAVEIARLLGAPLSDVMKNAGIEASDVSRLIPVIGRIDGNGVADVDWKSKAERVPGPIDLPADCAAVIADTAMSALELLDGWTYYVQSMRQDVAALIGRYCLVTVAAERQPRLGWIKRSPRPGSYNVILQAGETLKSVQVTAAAPILWIKT
jgi:transcriptional regulator with XRE-family HTH domain